MPTQDGNFDAISHSASPARSLPSSSDPAVHTVRTAWRRLTGGSSVRDTDRRTLIACSGGADSTALALALASLSTKPLLAHIVHDMRTESQAHADRDATRALATSIGLECVVDSISVSHASHNHEACARAHRYDALARIAQRHGIRWIATGHHADDQLETILMRLIRGTGPEGLAGVLPTRTCGNCTIIRPMLAVTKRDCERLCSDSGIAWCEDATNQDRTKLRAAIRASVLPVLEELAPGAAIRAAAAAQLQGELVPVLQDAIKQLRQAAMTSEQNEKNTLNRTVLASARPVVLTGLIREFTGEPGRDRRGKAALDQIRTAICDQDPKPREFFLGGATVRIKEKTVQIIPAAC